MNFLRPFSTTQRIYFEALFQKIREFYRFDLISIVVFGSYARGEARRNSDLDLLIVLRQGCQESLRQRQESFIKHVELPLERAFEKKLAEVPELSTLILRKEEAEHFNPLYLDMVESHVLILDQDNFLKKQFLKVKAQMQAWGSRKASMGMHWYWEIKPGMKWDEVIDYDERSTEQSLS